VHEVALRDLSSRVFLEDFAAKLPQSPQLTVVEYQGIQNAKQAETQDRNYKI
jgi:hypothetical protein